MENSRWFGRGTVMFLCFLHFNAFAQYDTIFCSLKHAHNTGKDALTDEMITTRDKDQIYYLCKSGVDQVLRRFKIYQLNTESNRLDSMIVEYPQGMTIVTLPFSFAVNGSLMVFNDDSYGKIFQFRRQKEKWIFDKEVIIRKNLRFRSVYSLSNDRFLFAEVYDSADPKTHPATLALYNGRTGLTEKIVHPKLACMAFAYFNIQPVAFNDRFIAISDLCQYKVHLYNDKLDSLTTISIKDDKLKLLKDGMLPFESDPLKVHPKIIIDSLLKLDKYISRIDRITFLNDSLLLVSITLPEHLKVRQADVWNIKEKTPWRYSSFIMPAEHVTEDYDPDRLPVFAESIGSPEVVNCMMIGPNSDPFHLKKKTSLSEFEQLKNRYYESHDPTYHFQFLDLYIPGLTNTLLWPKSDASGILR